MINIKMNNQSWKSQIIRKLIYKYLKNENKSTDF